MATRSLRGPIATLASHRVAANLLMVVIVVGGLVLSRRVKREVFPEVTLNQVVITVSYPGASPAEVEEGVVLVIEEAVRGIDGVDDVRAAAREGQAQVIAELEESADEDQVLDDIQNEVVRITSFPEDAERPIIGLTTNRRQVVSVIIHGNTDRQSLKNVAEQARQGLIATDAITQVEVTNIPPPEIHVEVPQASARRYGLTYDEIARRIGAASVDIAGGELETPSGDILVRTPERRDRGDQFAAIELIAAPGGGAVTIGDVGAVRDDFRDTDEDAQFNGEPAVRLDVYRSAQQSPLKVADAVHDYLQRARKQAPTGISFALWNDRSELYRDRISLLMKNAYYGIALVIIILGLFLDFRVAFWVTVGIPISFLGAFIAMSAFGVSLNMISLFAFILALGIVVDDAIVAGEAIFNKRQQGLEPLEAAISGVREVAGPVIFGVLTTITAFMPMLFIPGVSGEFFDNIPLIVIPILVVSLIEAFFILPRHLSHGGRRLAFLDPLDRFQRRFSRGLERFIDNIYGPALRRILRYNYVTLAAGLSILIVCAGIVMGGRLPFRFFPVVEGDIVTASVEMPFETSADVTLEVMNRLVDAAQRELETTGMTDHRGVYAVLGKGSAIETGPLSGPDVVGGHLASIAVFLPPAADRKVSAERFVAGWRTTTGEIAGVQTLAYEHSTLAQAGSPVAIELRHDDAETLERAASELAAALRSMLGVVDVDDGFELGKPQVELELTPAARALGITEAELGRQVRDAFFGAEAVRQQRGRDELRVYVRRPPSERASLYDVDNLIIRTPRGGEVPLPVAAHVNIGRSYTSIERVNGRRIVQVTADIKAEVTTANRAMTFALTQVVPELEARYPGLTHALSGEQKEQAESLGALRDGLLVALVVMFALTSLVFSSYVQPVIIMLVIPFGAIGAIAGHLLLGYDLSLISVLGLIALSGVVVNDSIVLVDAINQRRARGKSLDDAIVDGAMRRLRPIVLTSLTTFFGLMPMIFETSLQARFLIPMAISLAFGVLFATVITLVIVPCVYRLVEHARSAISRMVRKSPATPR